MTGLVKASLGLKIERKEVQRKQRRVGGKEKLEAKRMQTERNINCSSAAISLLASHLQ